MLCWSRHCYAGKYVIQAFLREVAEKYDWNPARYRQVVANVKRRWEEVRDPSRLDQFITPRDFERILSLQPSIFLSEGMELQVQAAIEEYRHTLFTE